MLKTIFACILLLKTIDTTLRVDPLVYTNVGIITGVTESIKGNYSMFLGIPYGKVDKSNPFGPATPYPTFEDVFEAYDDSSICPQFVNGMSIGLLDCLNLNIFVPNSATSANRLPVLIYIHGGSFTSESYSREILGPSYLVRHDVILVTMNYRLGPYGFMCLDIPEVPGNQGLKDQILAMKWIKDNIEAFGGDVDSITLFGESAGSVSVDFHLLYTKEQIFHKAIMQSGSTLCPWLKYAGNHKAPLLLAKHLGFITSDVREALVYLATKDSNLIIEASNYIGITFRPCVEKIFDDVENYIADHPLHVKPKHNVPLIIGITSREFVFLYAHKTLEELANLNETFDYLSGYFNFDTEQIIDMEEYVRHFYLGDRIVNEALRDGYIDFVSDFRYQHPIQRSISNYLDSALTKIYYYMFSYDGGRNYNKLKHNVTLSGAAHADDLGYLFDGSVLEGRGGPEDYVVVDYMTKMWTNFAKYGNPTPQTSEEFPVKWVPLNNELMYYMDIDSELSLRNRPNNDRMAFWDLFFKLNGKSQKGYTNNGYKSESYIFLYFLTLSLLNKLLGIYHDYYC